ncbi:glycosyltransferase [Alkalicoccobacillus gibsonii]|uniref:Glycosyltransferase n=1 Tax=Alkalicoccobacillus gibsonii TaxID=79881 RepID=A0ABU9VLJ8_9BACI
MRDIFMLINDLDVGRGGITRVFLDRASYFANDGLNSHIISFTYKEDFSRIYKSLIEARRLSTSVKKINMFDYYSEKNTRSKLKINENDHLLEEPEFKVHLEEFELFKHARYFDMNGQYRKYKKWNKDKELKFISYFTEDKVEYKREEYHPSGYKSRTRIYTKDEKKLKFETYFTTDGFAYLTLDYDLKTGYPGMIFLFNREDNKAKFFNGNALVNFQVYFLEELADNSLSKPVLINDSIELTNVIAKVDMDKMTKISTTHNNHFKAPFEMGAETKDNFKNLFKQNKSLDAIVLLTDSQYRDVKQEYPEIDNLYVVPNALSKLEEVKVSKDINLITVISRMDSQKNLGDIIKAFKIVYKENHTVKLRLFGKGPAEDEIKNLIKSEGIEEAIEIHGYTNEVNIKLKESIFTVMTSTFEGSPMIIRESMSVETPVICYDINYGPRDIIEDGVDGIIIKDRSITSLAERMQYLLNNPELAIKMGEKAKENVYNKFYEHKVKEMWVNLINRL